MRCTKARDYLERYKDGALATALRASMDEHLQGCSECRAELAAIETVGAHLRGSQPSTMPAELAGSIVAAARRSLITRQQAPITGIFSQLLYQPQVEGSMKKANMFKWWGFGAAAIAVVVAGSFAFVLRTNASSSRVVLKDDILENRKILHSASGHHACDCFSPLISYFTVSSRTSTTATLRWDCSEASTYQVNYGLTADKGTLFPASTPTVVYNDHSVTVTGLTPNTTYHVGPSSVCLTGCTRNDVAGLRKEWLLTNKSQCDWTFTTLAGTGVLDDNNGESGSAACAVSDAAVAKITAKDVKITWKTNISATSLVEYGLTTDYGMKSGVNTEMVRDHDIQLFNLREGTTYHCRTVSIGGNSGVAAYSKDLSFTTPALEERIVNKDHIFNEPNPCSDWTMFSYYSFQPLKRVTIDVMTLSGKLVASLESPTSALAEGWSKVRWDVRDNGGKLLNNGLYVCKMKFLTATNNEVEVRTSSLRVAR